LQENRSVATQFRQKPLLGKAQSPISFNALEILHGRLHDRRSAGTEDGAIADEIGMSVKMVSRYLRFADKAVSARASRDRRERKMAEFENSGRV
jgi:hypothetical protein